MFKCISSFNAQPRPWTQKSRQPVFLGNISGTEITPDITQININSTRFVISQFRDNTSETR